MAESAFYVVAYDVRDDTRRARVAKHLESLGERVQDSVFECYLTSAELEKLLKKLGRITNAEEDSLRVYVLCGQCQGKVRVAGLGKVTSPPEVKIV
jgi:CRISPR-associated protein Cas2